jgi:hypothetical protein
VLVVVVVVGGSVLVVVAGGRAALAPLLHAARAKLPTATRHHREGKSTRYTSTPIPPSDGTRRHGARCVMLLATVRSLSAREDDVVLAGDVLTAD